MPVLLLCRGDDIARNSLRHAIEARYGTNPPAIEKLRIQFEGRTRIQLGPIRQWVPVSAEASFSFPTQLRWDFKVKALNVPLQQHTEAFDGTTYRSQRTIGHNQKSVQTDLIQSAQERLWQIAAVLLTPLSEHYIELITCGTHCIQAVHQQLNSSVNLHLRENNTLARADVTCLNPNTEQMQTLSLQLDEEQQPIDGLMLPRMIRAYWDETIHFEIQPKQVDLNPTFSAGHFSLNSPTAVLNSN